MAQVVFRRILKTLAIIILLLLVATMGLIFYLKSPSGQKQLSAFVIKTLSDRLKTPVEGNISYGFPDWVKIDNLLIKDQQSDTLLSAKRAYIDLDMLAYLDNALKINKLELEGSLLNIYKKDSVFNYSYAMAAFSSTKPKDSTAVPLSYELQSILAKNLIVRYSDPSSKQKLQAKFGDLQTGFSKIDIEKNQFFLKNTSLANTYLAANFGETAEDSSVSKSNSKLPDIQIQEFATKNFNWDVALGGNKTVGKGINLDLEIEKIDLPKESISLNKLVANADNITYSGMKGPKTVAGQLNFQDLGLTDFVLKTQKLSYNKEKIEGEILKLSVKEKSGFEIKELTGSSVLKNKKLVLENLNLKTNNSELKSKAEIVLNPTDLTKSVFSYQLISSNLSATDALYFNRELSKNPYFQNISKDKISLIGKFYGDLSNLKFEKVNLKGIQNSSLSFSGTVKDLNNPLFDLNIASLTSSKADVLRLLPADVLPENVNIPNNFTLKGSVKGKIADFNSDLTISSEQGIAHLNSRIINSSGGLAYSGKLNTQAYKVGDLMNNPTIGSISSVLEFKGKGTSLKTADLMLSGNVSEAFYEGKKYQNITFSGDLKNQIFNTKLAVNDPSAGFTWEGKVDLSKPIIELEGKSKLDFVNLQKLGITQENIIIKGDIDLKNIVLDPKSPFIDFQGKNINVYKDDVLFPIGDIKVITSTKDGNNKLEATTSFINLSLSGDFDYNQLQNIMLNEVNNYFKLLNFKPTLVQNSYNFRLDGKVSYNPVFSAFLPAVKSFSDVVVHATLQSEGDIPIEGSVQIPFLQYDSIKVYNTNFDYSGDRKALKYQLLTKQITNNDLRVRNASLVGKLENNIGSFDLSVKDSLDQDIHSLTGFVQSVNNQLQISFDEDGSMLYYEPWAGNPYGSITYSSAGILINDVIFTSKNQILRVSSLNDEPNGPLHVFSQNIDLNFLAQAFLQDSAFVAGYADLDLEILNYMEGTPSFTGDVLVTDFEMNKTKLGTLEGKAESNSLEQIRLTATLKGEVTDLDVKGYYYPKKEESLDFNADIKNIDLAAIQYFVKDVISSVDGNVSGKFEIKGSTEKPIVKGEALFPKFNFVLVETGAKLKLIKQKVSLKDQKAIFDHVVLQDEDDKKMDLNGRVDFSAMPNYSYDFDIETDEFKLINAKTGQSELFKGAGYVGADLQLTGRNLDFRLTGDIDVKDKTDLTLLLSDESDAVSDMESVVKFVDFDAPKTVKTETKKEVLSFANAVNINVDVPTKATLKILMDPITGDLMSVNGSGKLNVGFDNTGDLFILGRYDIETGKYELTYQAIKKAFAINPSSKSHIVWSGDPMSALLDITAEFNAGKKALLTYPFEKSSTTDRLKSSKIIVPIRVDLRVMGVLSSPDIKFELVANAADLSDLKTAVEEEGFRTIADNGTKSTNDEEFKRYQSTINANAIMLLVGGGFNAAQIGENITNYENLARQKVSDLISNQLDKYASGLIKGIDLDLGLQSGYNTTNDFRNTNLNLGVSKKLANDRISISVGKNFELENKDLKSDEIFDNIEANWQITKDGRYRLKVFRKNLNQMVIEGSVVETGVGFIIAIDYETWKELMKGK
ncbi:translocation/assembly module TamB domain-containing protein [Lacihabitans soyangensis]|uniref:Translocation/assembly module TamB n=1 Tax=Lacihabitans soyangensis TaxID=869394 RepID=A0AAE3H0B6_9BACT|nr:translocation/assembly module TamB domain-containing protein [Lacihabitans soyangensis]MCP9762553.1 hypothetical protein [Lacihabitans soyangensis]